MKPLCIVDTCSLIYMSEVELGRKTLHNWLWDEFDVTYSNTVYREIENNKNKMEREAKRQWKKYVSKLSKPKNTKNISSIENYEDMLFGFPLERKNPSRTCSKCGQNIVEIQRFTPDLKTDKNRGERHNVCLAFHKVIKRESSQIIFITDDKIAIRDYVKTVFDTFYLGQIWSSLDFVTYLFVRHQNKMTAKGAENALRDIIAKEFNEKISKEEEEQRINKIPRFTQYIQQIKRIESIFARAKGVKS